MSRRILKNLVDLATGTFVSRVFGFLRELVTAAYYGTHRAMDLFVIAFTIPTFFREVLGEDVVERAFMPPFKKLIAQQKYRRGWQLLSSCLNLMIAVLIVLMIVLYLLAPLVVKAIAPGLADDLLPSAIKMTYCILPFMFIIGMAAFAGGILNFFEMNKIYSLAPAMMSVGVIIVIIFFKKSLGIYALPVGFLLGGLFELLIQVPFVLKKKIRSETSAHYFFTINTKEKAIQKIARESGFIFLKSLLDKSVEIVDRILASFLISGSIASLWFAHRLILLPVAIVGLAISRSLIPYLTEKQALVQNEDFLSGVRLGIQLNFTLVLPVTMIMIVMAEPIIRLVYQRGSFDAESTRLTAIAFWCYSAGLLGLSMNAFLSRIFSIFQKNRIPFYVAIFSALVNVALNFLLVKTPLKHGGIALASSIAFLSSCVVLFAVLLKEVKHQIRAREIWGDFSRLFLFCLAIGIFCYYLYFHYLRDLLARLIDSNFLQYAVGFLIVFLTSLLIYAGLVFQFGPIEVRRRLKTLLKRQLKT